MFKAVSEPIQLFVPEHLDGLRADKVLACLCPEWSRTRLQTAFARGEVWLEGEPIEKKQRLVAGDALEVILPEVAAPSVSPVALPLEILYEDEAIVAVNKACGMVTHPGHGTGEDTLVHALLHHTGGQLAPQAGALRPGVVHRLDKETTGVIVFAKTDAAYRVLTKRFALREGMEKSYLALVQGVPPRPSGTIEEGIRRHPVHRTRMQAHGSGRESRTDWQLEAASAIAARLRCRIHTGRTHQIRVHLAHLGFPILGDGLYGYRYREQEPPEARERVFLHAWRLAMPHPLESGRMLELEAPLPADFCSLQERLGLA